MKHARLFSASGAADAMVCPAKPVMSLHFPRNSSEAAAKGTMKHEICHRVMTAQIPLSDFLGSNILVEQYQFEVTQEDIDHCQFYIDHLDQNALEGDLLWLEHKMPLEIFTGESGAVCTADALIIRDDPIHGLGLGVVDAKFGSHQVNVGPQLQTYLAVARRHFSEHKFNWFFATIVQPPLDHIDYEEFSPAELDEIETQILAAANQVFEAEKNLSPHHFNPGSTACRYCPAVGRCKPLYQHISRFMEVDLSADVYLLSDEEMSAQFTAANEVIGYFKAVQSRGMVEVLNGKKMPGLKIVRGREGNRRWESERDVERLLLEGLGEEEAYSKSLISPTQAEKKLGKTDLWDKVVPHITRNPGPLLVVPESDKRPEYTSDSGISANMFD